MKTHSLQRVLLKMVGLVQVMKAQKELGNGEMVLRQGQLFGQGYLMELLLDTKTGQDIMILGNQTILAMKTVQNITQMEVVGTIYPVISQVE